MKKRIVLIGGIVVIAVLIYLWWKNKNNAAASAGSPTSETIVNPVTGSQTGNWLAGNGTVQVPLAVQQWASSNLGPQNQAIFQQQLPNMTAADMQGLYDIIINSWGKGAQPTQSQVSFINSFASRYGMIMSSSGSFSSFTGKPRVSQYGKRRVR